MLEEGLFRLLEAVERLGLNLSVVAWLSIAAATVVMGYVLRRVRQPRIWAAAAIVTAVALAGNLADYFVTLHRSPDLSWEANPIWRNVIDAWGLRAAKWYGLSGKILVSIVAGQMWAFYLSNQKRLFPDNARSLAEFLRRMGNRSETRGQRIVALFTLLSFFFAGVQLLYFYIAYLNWIEDPELAGRLPSAPVAILILLLALAAAFTAHAYRDFRSWEGR